MSVSNSSASVPANHKPVKVRQGQLGGITQATFDSIKHYPGLAYQLMERAEFVLASESDVANVVGLFVGDVATALHLHVKVISEMQIFEVRPDLWVIRKSDGTPIGAVEVKKPGADLDNPAILGELFDQMKQLQNFYGHTFSIGILATGNAWRVCWYGDNPKMMSSMADEEDYTPPDSFELPAIPSKSDGGVSEQSCLAS